MTGFPVPTYLAETARRVDGLSDWIAGLPPMVAELAERWSLRVGAPFEPGGQCSWTAPATGPDGQELVLKVAFRFPGDEERDEAAGLRIWDGNGAVRLRAAHQGEQSYALLLERCDPGTPLGQALAEPEQDEVVARLLRQLWSQPHAAYPFRPLAEMRCAICASVGGPIRARLRGRRRRRQDRSRPRAGGERAVPPPARDRGQHGLVVHRPAR